MTTLQTLTLTAVVLAIALAAVALTIDRVLTRRRARTIMASDSPRRWAMVTYGAGIQCPLPECGSPVDAMRGEGPDTPVALTPCGHAVDRHLITMGD